MADLIDRQAAIEALNEVSEHYTEKGREWHPHISFMIDAIKELPSVQPEIIRCKDCLMHGVCRFEQGLGLDGYCSQAERRTE